MWGMTDPKCIKQTDDRNYWEYSEDQIFAMIMRYNGYGDDAKNIYAPETYDYYLIFSKYN